MNKDDCVKRIIETFLEHYQLYLQHIRDYGEILLHLFVSEAINEPLCLLLKNRLDAKAYCEIVEAMWKSGDDEVQNVVDVTVLERLSDDDAVWQQFGKSISSEFRDYINHEVLAQNVLMAAVKKIGV
jgi:hypothetical protein